VSMENRFGEVLATFNSVAGYKAVHLRLELMLEEIRVMLENAQSDGLQEKACAAIPLWVEWQEWNRVHRNGGELLSGPNVAETDLVLNSAALGSEPRDIMREVMLLRAENGLNDTPGAVDATSTFLDRFNEFAEVKALTTEMWIRLEEIEIAVRSDQGEGLQEKCEIANQFWEIWLDWRRAHSDGKDPAEFERQRQPNELQTDFMLKLGILGWEPAEIRRRLEQRRQENGWPAESPVDAMKAQGAEDALYPWGN